MLIYLCRFSQTFIDIKEKERKRGARGLVTVPNKTQAKLEQKLLNAESINDTSSTTTNDTTTKIHSHLTTTEPSKTDDLTMLQQKITKEIFSSNLKETEMNELQVSWLFIVIYWRISSTELFCSILTINWLSFSLSTISIFPWTFSWFEKFNSTYRFEVSLNENKLVVM